MIKLIVTDIDGTVVPEGTNDINPELFSIIKELKSKGIRFAVASGRHKCSIEKMFAPVKNDIFYITSNGAYLGTIDKKLCISSLSENVCHHLFSDFDSLGLPYYIETVDAAYTNCPDPEFTRILNEEYGYDMRHCDCMKDVADEMIKLSAFHPEDIKPVASEHTAQWNRICKAVISGRRWIDFMTTDINKGVALGKLQEVLGITIHETLAFGDQNNDIEMLKQAYFSYAVDNANPSVKNAARFTCDSCQNQGVIKTLKSIFFNEE